jgi:hypothetical protein
MAKLFELGAKAMAQGTFRAKLVEKLLGFRQRVFAAFGAAKETSPRARNLLFG